VPRKKRAAFDKYGRVLRKFSAQPAGMKADTLPKANRASAPPEEAIAARLAAHPFLAGMSDRHLAILAECALATHFEPGQVIFRAGEPANGFYLLETGKVVLEEPPTTIDIVAAGEPLGWSWLFAPYLWQFDARAIEPCRALCLSGIALRQHRDDDLFLSHELFKRTSEVMVRRLQAARTRLSAAQKNAGAAKPATSLA
jgi:CRP/FNR family transcriptional regulator, cyclic AMP receptor protein